MGGSPRAPLTPLNRSLPISLRTFFNVSVMMPIVRGYTSRCGAYVIETFSTLFQGDEIACEGASCGYGTPRR